MPGPILPGNISGAISEWIQQGLSQRKALEVFRSPTVGGKIGNERFRQIWNMTAAILERKGQMAALPTNRVPARDLYSPWAMGKPGRFGTQVGVFVRDTETGMMTVREFTHFSRQPVSPNVAIAEAINTYTDGLDENPDYQTEVIEGGVVTGLYFTVPREQ